MLVVVPVVVRVSPLDMYASHSCICSCHVAVAVAVAACHTPVYTQTCDTHDTSHRVAMHVLHT